MNDVSWPEGGGNGAAGVPPELLEQLENIAQSVHETWAGKRRAEGWRHGPRRDDGRKLHPSLVPYPDLPEAEKAYDRSTILTTLTYLVNHGYEIRKQPLPVPEEKDEP